MTEFQIVRVAKVLKEPMEATVLRFRLWENNNNMVFDNLPPQLLPVADKIKHGITGAVVFHEATNLYLPYPIILGFGKKIYKIIIDPSSNDLKPDQLRVGVIGACSIALSLRPDLISMVLYVSQELDNKRSKLVNNMFSIEK